MEVSVTGTTRTINCYLTIGATQVGTKTSTHPSGGSLTYSYAFACGNMQNSNVCQVTAGSGTIPQRKRYAPYGASRQTTPVTFPNTDRGFLNQPHDTNGLVYLNNRYHDPTIGHFTSVDPLVGKTGQPYLYGDGNPATLSDPSGLAPCEDEGNCGWSTRQKSCAPECVRDPEAQKYLDKFTGGTVKNACIDEPTTCIGVAQEQVWNDQAALTAMGPALMFSHMWRETSALIGADPRACVGQEASVVGCGIEAFGVVPWGAGKKAFPTPAPTGLSDDLARLADSHLTGSGETVLGHGTDDYVGLAQSRGASYFDIGDTWNDLSPAQRWAANQRVLDAAIGNGDRIILATSRQNIRFPSVLADEIQYLASNGYTWLDDTTLVPG